MAYIAARTKLQAYWYEALAAPLGIWITTPSPHKLKSILYAARIKAADPDLMGLEIRTSVRDPKGEVWIVKVAAPSSED